MRLATYYALHKLSHAAALLRQLRSRTTPHTFRHSPLDPMGRHESV
jgi:hypothetical protein